MRLSCLLTLLGVGLFSGCESTPAGNVKPRPKLPTAVPVTLLHRTPEAVANSLQILSLEDAVRVASPAATIFSYQLTIGYSIIYPDGGIIDIAGALRGRPYLGLASNARAVIPPGSGQFQVQLTSTGVWPEDLDEDLVFEVVLRHVEDGMVLAKASRRIPFVSTLGKSREPRPLPVRRIP